MHRERRHRPRVDQGEAPNQQQGADGDEHRATQAPSRGGGSVVVVLFLSRVPEPRPRHGVEGHHPVLVRGGRREPLRVVGSEEVGRIAGSMFWIFGRNEGTVAACSGGGSVRSMVPSRTRAVGEPLENQRAWCRPYGSWNHPSATETSDVRVGRIVCSRIGQAQRGVSMVRREDPRH